MELEVREVSGEEKSKLGHRLKAYNNEMERFEQDLVSEDFNYNIRDYIQEGKDEEVVSLKDFRMKCNYLFCIF